MNITIYTTGYCPFCTAAKNLLRGKKIDFEEVNVEEDPQKRDWLTKTTGQKTVPQIFINDKSIGGFIELQRLDQSGKLDKLLK